MGSRAERESMMIEALAPSGFVRDFRENNTVTAYEYNRGLGYVAPGATQEGRGTSADDLSRAVRRNGQVVRVDFLSLKAHKIGADGKWPSYGNIITGTRDTILSVVDSCKRGAAFPVLHFISQDNADGPSSRGWALAYDAAPYIRASGLTLDSSPPPVGFSYGKGKAPTHAYLGMEKKKSGRNHVPGDAGQWRWNVDASTVAYPVLKVGYSTTGLDNGWVPCDIADLPAIVEGSFDWRPGGHSFVW